MRCAGRPSGRHTRLAYRQRQTAKMVASHSGRGHRCLGTAILRRSLAGRPGSSAGRSWPSGQRLTVRQRIFLHKETKMSRIAFIGLGNMGGPMALNLIKAGHELVVFDLAAAALKAASDAGATAAASAQEAVKGADVVITMLPASKHVEGLYLGESALIDQIAAGTLVLECSTIAPESARKVADAARGKGVRMIDAPVSGGTGGAVAGTLTFIVGGEADDLEAARPYLEKMGKNIFHAGAAGAGQVAKICNNMLLGILMAGTSEALALGAANGLDTKVLSDIIAKSSGRNW